MRARRALRAALWALLGAAVWVAWIAATVRLL